MKFKFVIAGFALLSISLSIGSILVNAQSKSTWKAPEKAKKLENPLKPSDRVLKAGDQIFKQLCTVCHGKAGKGDGIAAASLNPKPANLTSEIVQKQTDGEIFWKIDQGRSPMPTFKNQLSEKQIWAVVDYIRTLKPK